MSTKSKITCAALAAHMNANHHIAWPSIKRMSEMTSLSKKSIERAIQEVESAGWLSVDRGGLNRGTSRYTPIFPAEIERLLGTQSRITGVTESPVLASESRPNQSIESDNNNNPHPADADVSDSFLKFWDLYPRKVDKGPARKRWDKMTHTQQKLAIEDIRTRYEGCDRQFIPYPSTYLNKERYLDERPPGASGDIDDRGAL